MEDFQNLIYSHREWLLIDSAGKSFPLKNDEIEIENFPNKTLFSFLDDKGFQTWRIVEIETKKDEITLHLSRNFEKEKAKIRLVPRISAQDLGESVELARLEKANKIAGIIKNNLPKSKLVRVELNKENGRFAQIIFENPFGKQTAVLADVSDNLTPEILLSTAILWQTKISARKKNPIENVWISAEKKQSKNLQKLHALLRENWKKRILIKEFSFSDSESENALKELPALEISQLWRKKKREIKQFSQTEISAAAQKIIEFAPNEIDVIFAKNGETLRFNGLPFARVRKVFDKEQIWLGVEKEKQILSENIFRESRKLIENLQELRRFDSMNKRHEIYRNLPEAWLESVLRRNIHLLDANLILSPVYHQFRAERDKIDLLGLRKDGRLVIIELKVSPDREVIFQSIDYWRKIENERRAGNLEKARLFGELEIKNAPTICYLVAPTLSFHREFNFLLQTVTPEIEIYRFNLAENWRENLKVLERI